MDIFLTPEEGLTLYLFLALLLFFILGGCELYGEKKRPTFHELTPLHICQYCGTVWSFPLNKKVLCCPVCKFYTG